MPLSTTLPYSLPKQRGRVPLKVDPFRLKDHLHSIQNHLWSSQGHLDSYHTPSQSYNKVILTTKVHPVETDRLKLHGRLVPEVVLLEGKVSSCLKTKVKGFHPGVTVQTGREAYYTKVCNSRTGEAKVVAATLPQPIARYLCQ
jgi:hypothetical protein